MKQNGFPMRSSLHKSHTATVKSLCTATAGTPVPTNIDGLTHMSKSQHKMADIRVTLFCNV